MSPTLAPQHEEYVTKRGVSLDTAAAVGLHSVSEADGAKLIAFAKPLKCPSLAIPYYDESGAVVMTRVRLDKPDEDGPKFLGPAKTPVRPYLPPPPVVPSSAWADAAIEIAIVEGPVKALALCDAGELAIGLGGVLTGHDVELWRAKNELRVHSDVARRVTLKDRPVLIIFDAGRATNPMVALGEARLAAALRASGARVRVAALPFRKDGGDQGPDDYLAEHGHGAIEKLRAQAAAADPVERVRSLGALKTREARVDAARILLADLPFIASLHVGGQPVVDVVAAELKRVADVGKRAIQERVDAFVEALRGKAARAEGDGQRAVEQPYDTVDGRLCYLRDDGRGGTQAVPLCNFDARIVEEVAYDDGAEVTRTFKITSRLRDGAAMPTATVAAAEFGALNWVSREFGARAVIAAGNGTRDRIREAIQTLSTPSARTIFRHSGWREVGGELVFLHAGGAIGTDGVAVELDPPHDRLVLPAAPVELRDAVAWSLRILDLAPPVVTVPLLASTYLAPLAHWTAPDFGVWFWGKTGTMKSTLVALGQGHFGAFDRLHLPANWTFTDNAIEAVLHRYKDVLCVVDDYAPAADHRTQVEVERRAQRIVRNIGNRAARGRLRADLSQRPDRPPRGVVLATGEDVPPGGSILARLVVVKVPIGCINTPLLSKIQQSAARLPHAMRGYIEWLRGKASSFPRSLQSLRAHLRDDLLVAGGHLRQPDALALLAVGFEALVAFAQSVGACDDDRADELRTIGLAALKSVGEEQVALQAHTSPAHRFIAELGALLAQGRVELVPRTKLLDPAARGVTAVPGRIPIGWRDEQYAYCEPVLTRRVIAGSIRQSGEAWAHSDLSLARDLVADGFMVPGPDGHNAAHVRVAGESQPRRVWRLRIESIAPGAPHVTEHGEAYEDE